MSQDKSFKAVVLNRGGAPPRGASINFKGGATPCALRNMDSFINKLTDKYICLHKFFVFKGLDTKDNYLKGAR